MVFKLETPLFALKEYNQFVLWRLEDRGELKKTKVPFSHKTQREANAQDPANWLDIDSAIGLAELYGCGVGFVLTENDPFFCIDLDNQRNADLTWTDWSQNMIKFFDGAATEVSYSGNGFHIFGKATNIPASHKVKSKEIPGLEVYTKKRFIALGDPISGDASLDRTTQLMSCIESVGGAKSDNDAPAEWSLEPVVEWVGPLDDDQLINLMTTIRSSVSAAQAFDGAQTPQKATLADLWNMNTEALGMTYPSGTGKDFDHSSADMALMMHLAFWTGKNCARMDRLYRQSKLMRPKWDRDGYGKNGYLVTTVLEAVNRQEKVFIQKQANPLYTTGVESTTNGVKVEYRDGFQILMPEEQQAHFEGCIYIQDVHKVLNPRGELLKPEVFRAWYGGYEFIIDHQSKTSKDAWEVFTQSRIVSFPKANGLCFRPELPPGECNDEEGRILVNTYVPAHVDMVEGDVSPFIRHMRNLIPDERDLTIIMSYAAACVQYPGVKFQWCPVLQGVEGNGKSLLARCMTKAVGERYTHSPNASEIASKFNGWIDKKLLIICDEIHFKGNQEIQDALKKMVTDDRIEIQAKGQDQYTGDNRANWFMTTNHRDAVIKTRDGRRYSVFFTAQQSKYDIAAAGMGENTGYFKDLYDWLKFQDGYARVSYFLKNFAIPDEFNPATHCHTAPRTTSDTEAMRESMGPIEQLIQEAVEEGIAPGFRGGWLSITMVRAMLVVERKNISLQALNKIFQGMGYIRHPNLLKGRTTTIMPEEGYQKRPVLLVLNNSTNELIEKEHVVEAYRTAQNYAPLPK